MIIHTVLLDLDPDKPVEIDAALEGLRSLATLPGVVSMTVRSARGVRCWWCWSKRVPALALAVNAPISTSGWPSSRRSSSPPAYPVAPATAME